MSEQIGYCIRKICVNDDKDKGYQSTNNNIMFFFDKCINCKYELLIKIDLGIPELYDSLVRMLPIEQFLNFDKKILFNKLNQIPECNQNIKTKDYFCYTFESNCIQVVIKTASGNFSNLLAANTNESKEQSINKVDYQYWTKSISKNRKTSELKFGKNTILQEFNNLNRRKSIMFEERQNSFFLDTMRKNLSTNIERFHLREVYTNRSNNILTDLDGCFLVQKKKDGFITDESCSLGPTIYVIESKSRFDKIKIDQKIIQICKFQQSLLEYMMVGSLSNNSKKFQQMIKRYKLVENFRSLDFKLVFSYQFIDKFCIEYLESINNGTICESYEELTLKMFKYNNNYTFLTRKFPHLKQAKNLQEFREMYKEIVECEENCKYFSLNAIDKFIIDYEYLAEYMEYMQSRICIMSRTEIIINGNKIKN